MFLRKHDRLGCFNASGTLNPVVDCLFMSFEGKKRIADNTITIEMITNFLFIFFCFFVFVVIAAISHIENKLTKSNGGIHCKTDLLQRYFAYSLNTRNCIMCFDIIPEPCRASINQQQVGLSTLQGCTFNGRAEKGILHRFLELRLKREMRRGEAFRGGAVIRRQVPHHQVSEGFPNHFLIFAHRAEPISRQTTRKPTSQTGCQAL